MYNKISHALIFFCGRGGILLLHADRIRSLGLWLETLRLRQHKFLCGPIYYEVLDTEQQQ